MFGEFYGICACANTHHITTGGCLSLVHHRSALSCEVHCATNDYIETFAGED